MKTFVLISKRWYNPEIEISLYSFNDMKRAEGEEKAEFLGGKMEIKIDIQDFLKILSKEIGNPTFHFTRNQTHKKMVKAAETIFREMKHKTAEIT